jgi:2'-5' RNA ligase
MILVVVCDFKLNKKPKWLDNYRKKWDKPYSYHVTLKNPTNFSIKDIDKIKKDLKEISQKYNSFKVKFNKLYIGLASRGYCVMIKAEKNKELLKLQKDISKTLSKYGVPIKPLYSKFEKNFKPHITIARYLTKEQLKLAKTELKKNLNCETIIDKFTLKTVNKDSFEDWNSFSKKTNYNFKK